MSSADNVGAFAIANLSAALHAAGDAQRYFIVKADDYLFDKPATRKFSKLFALCRQYDVPVSLGVSGEGLVNPRPQDRQALLDMHRCGLLELWNHSFQHHDLTAMSATQIEHELTQCNEVCQRELGLTPVGFGAPYNKSNAQVVAAAQKLGLRFAYEALFPSEEVITPEYNVPMDGQPHAERFIGRARLLAHRKTIVIQIHPYRWLPQAFTAFAEIIRWLQAQGYVAMTVTGLLDKILATAPDKLPGDAFAGMIAGLGELWLANKNKYLPTLPNFESYYLKYFVRDAVPICGLLTELAMDVKAPVVVDVGSGLGQWSLPFLTYAPAMIEAFDVNDTIAAAMHDAGQAGQLPAGFHFHHEDFLTTTRITPGSVWRVMCCNAINYMPLLPFVEKTREIIRNIGHVVLTFQTGYLNYYDCRGVLKQGDFARAFERALTEIQQFLVRQGFAGLMPWRRSQTLAELEAVFYVNGFRLYDTFLPPLAVPVNALPIFKGAIFSRDHAINITTFSDKHAPYRLRIRKLLCQAGYPAHDGQLFDRFTEDYADQDLVTLKSRGLGADFAHSAATAADMAIAAAIKTQSYEHIKTAIEARPSGEPLYLLAGFVLAAHKQDLAAMDWFIGRLRDRAVFQQPIYQLAECVRLLAHDDHEAASQKIAEIIWPGEAEI